MERFEVRKVWEDETSEIIHQEMSEAEAHMISYTYNCRLPKTAPCFFEARPQEINVPIALRLRR